MHVMDSIFTKFLHFGLKNFNISASKSTLFSTQSYATQPHVCYAASIAT